MEDIFHSPFACPHYQMSVTNEGIGSTVNYKLRRKRGAGGREGDQRAIDKPFIRRVAARRPPPIFHYSSLAVSVFLAGVPAARMKLN